MMNNKPLLSVVIPTYNHAKYIQRTLDSVLSQGVPDMEILIYDDCSSDGTVELVRRYLDDGRVKLVQQPRNLGPKPNNQQALNAARGRYLVWLSGDDYFFPGHLRSGLEVLEAHPEIALVYSPCYWVDEDDRVIRVLQHAGHASNDYVGGRNEVAELLVHDNYITPSSAIFRTEWFHEAGDFDPEIRGGDWDLFIRIARRHPDFAFLHTPRTAYRIHSEQCSHEFYASTDPLVTHLRVLEKTLDSAQAGLLVNHIQALLDHFASRLSGYTKQDLLPFTARIEAIADRLRGLVENPPVASEPLVSVIVATYNRPDLLQYALQSLIAQDYQNWEAVVVNDAGVEVGALVESLDPRGRIRCLSHDRNKGLSAARNTGIEFSRGELLCYLDDDDTFRPGHLRTAIAELHKSGADFVYTEAEYVEEEVKNGRRRELRRSTPHSNIEYSKEQLHIANYIPVNTWLHRRWLLNHTGVFDTELSALEDWDLLLRFSRLVDFHHIPELTVQVHMRVASRQEHMSRREARDFPELFKKIYERYDIGDNRKLHEARERQLREMEERAGKEDGEPDRYQQWVKGSALSERDRLHFVDRMQHGWTQRPAIHLVVTHVSGLEEALADTLDSLAAQLYGGWGLSVVSTAPCPDSMFEEIGNLEWIQADGDLLQVVNGVAAESSAAWIALLEAGDIFEPHMLYTCVNYLQQHPHWCLIYTDEDRLAEQGERHDPLFKPDFNLELLRSVPYMGNFLLVKRETLLSVGGYTGDEAVTAHDIAFKVQEFAGSNAIGHIPEVLRHRQDRFQRARDEKQVAEQRRLAVDAHLHRSGMQATVQHGTLFGSYRVEYAQESKPAVDIIVPLGADQALFDKFIDSLLNKTTYPEFHVQVLVGEGIALSLSEPLHKRVRVTPYSSREGQWAAVNHAVAQADGEYVLLMQCASMVLQPNWLDTLVAHLQRAEVAVVAPRLISSHNRVVDGGIVVGGGGYSIGAIAHCGLALDEPGYMGRAQVAQEVGAVSLNCMLIRKAVFQQVGGLPPQLGTPLYQAVDLCLRVAAREHKIVWTPHATLLYVEQGLSAEHAQERATAAYEESDTLYRRWMPQLARDPAYSPRLLLRSADSSFEDELVPSWQDNDSTLPRIVGFGVGSYGSWKYRVAEPVDVLHRERVANGMLMKFSKDRVRMPTVAELERMQPDCLLFHNTVHDHTLDAMRAYRKHNRAFIVFGQDDLTAALPPKNPFSKTVYRDINKRIRNAIEIADRLLVTTQPLAEALGKYAGDVHVLPNYLDASVWGDLHSQRGQGDKPRVGWAGAQQHLGDLELLEQVVAETADEVDWIFFGMCPRFLRPYVKEIHNPVIFEEYPQKLASLNLDLALAPLEYNRFNQCKSNLRLLEYGAMGWPVIATDIEPYREGPICTVPNQPRAWIKAIRERAHDLQAAYREGDVLQAWVHKHWLLQNNLDKWLAALDPDLDTGRYELADGNAAGL